MKTGDLIALFRRAFWYGAISSSLEHGEELYIVGGILRDALLGRELKDVDIVFRSPSLSFPFRFASEIGGKVIVLGREKRIFRVTKFPFTFDFNPLNGLEILKDLSRRDFTVNSLALDIREEKVLDPFNGLADIERGLIRVERPQSFDDDPVRLLRAFRFESTLGFRIEERTKSLIELKSWNLSPWKASPKERISEEWKKLIAGREFYRALKDMVSTGYLDRLFPAFRLMRGMPQGSYHHLDVLAHSVKVVEALEDVVSNPPPWVKREFLEQKIGALRRREILRLAALFHDIGKPFCFRIKDGEVNFKGHQLLGAKIGVGYSRALLLGHKERELIYKLIYNHMMPLFFLKRERAWRPWERSLLHWLMKVKEEALSVFLLSLADLRATRGIKVSDEERSILAEIGERAKRYLDDMLKVKPLLNGREIMALTCLKEGREIGIIKDRILYLQKIGKLKTKDEALKKILGII